MSIEGNSHAVGMFWAHSWKWSSNLLVFDKTSAIAVNDLERLCEIEVTSSRIIAHASAVW